MDFKQMGGGAACALLALLLQAAVAAEPPAADADAALLTELMAVVDEGTAVATQTRMNVDYVPGMVTVLESDLLQSLGARTVLDALSLVPGVLSYLGNSGEPFLLVRGTQFPFNSGNVKVLVNSIAMSREDAAISSSVLHMPIEQVERLEFVRGPGSVLYGDFAYMGLLNIVTRAAGSSVFARAQDNGNVTAGGRAGYASADGVTKFSLNAAAERQNEPEVPEPPPGSPVNDSDQRHYAMLTFAHRGFSADLQSMARSLERVSAAGNDDEAHVLQLRQALGISPTLSGSLQVSGLRSDASSANRAFKGDLYEAGGTLEWRGLARHVLVTKLTYTHEAIDATRSQSPPPPPPAPPPPTVTRQDLERRYYGLALEDQYAMADSFTVTVGARYDKREDIDDERVTPRLAAVWRAANAHILKAQYSEGYRAPTFFELYPAATGQSDLDLETVATSELSYIHRAPQRVARLTLFHSNLDDMIFSRSPGSFGNVAEGSSTGAEGEFEQQLTGSLKWLANISYADSWSDRNASATRQADPPAALWLGTLALIYRPVGSVLLATHLNYVGERNSANPTIDPEYRVAVSASALDVLTRGLNLRAVVRNAAGEDVHTAVTNPAGVTSVRVFDDTIFSLSLAYDFR
jgi:iron complex outermembrane receptor protein